MTAATRPEQLRIVPVSARHADAVLAICRAGIDAGNATFETRAPAWPQFAAGKLAGHSYVAAGEDGTVLGWVAASPVSARPVSAGVAGHSVYAAAGARGRGVGGRLLRALIASAEAAGIGTIQAAVFGENAASLALHERAGLRVAGARERSAASTAAGATCC